MPFSRSCLALASAALAGAAASPAHAQTVLTGHYNGQTGYSPPSDGNGYVAAPGQSYLLTSTATFDDNGNSGFVGADGAITVDGADVSGNGNHGLTAGGDVTVNGGTFQNNYFEGVNLNGGTGTVNGGTFSGNGEGIRDVGGLLTVNGGTFGFNTFAAIYALDGATLNVTGGDFTAGTALDVYDDSQAIGPQGFDPASANIYGGDFAGASQALVAGGTTITVYGTFVGGPQTLQGIGTFTGTLQDGGGLQTISYATEDDDEGYQGRIVLVNAAPAVPEPSPLALLALGVLPAGLLARGRAGRRA
jgi:hypothetical protein